MFETCNVPVMDVAIHKKNAWSRACSIPAACPPVHVATQIGECKATDALRAHQAIQSETSHQHAATQTGSAPDADHPPCAVDFGKEDAANNFRTRTLHHPQLDG